MGHCLSELSLFSLFLWCLDHKVYFRHWNWHNDCMEYYTTHNATGWEHSKTGRKVWCLVLWWKINPVLHQTALQIHLTDYSGSRLQILVWICIGFDGGRGISIHYKNAEAQGGTKLNCYTTRRLGGVFELIKCAYGHVTITQRWETCELLKNVILKEP